MELKIKGKVAVVTAASKGLGRAVAEALAGEGVNLALCARNEEDIIEAADYLAAIYDVETLPVVCDVTDSESIADFKEKVIQRFKTCHILFANAGGPPPGIAQDFVDDDYRKALELNLISTINLTNTFLPFMIKQKWGRILASTSVTVKQPIPTLALSNVSRAGVVAYVKTLSKEVASENVTVNTIAPGYIMTERVEALLQNKAKKENIPYEKAMQNLRNTIPTKKIGDPAEFGALCAFIASDLASYITGETILIDGGIYNGMM